MNMKEVTICELLNKIKKEKRLLVSIKEEGLGYRLRSFINDVELSIKQLISDDYFKMDDEYISNMNDGLSMDKKRDLKTVDTYMNQNIIPYKKKEKVLFFKMLKNKILKI